MMDGYFFPDSENMETAALIRNAEEFLHREIPLTREMGLRVVGNDDAGFIVEAPVARNSNHLRTAFGGSINAVATLAGYGLLWMELRGVRAHVVIRESSIRFLLPIRETIRAICERPTPNELEAFRLTLHAKGKARITLHVRCEENSRVAAEFEGKFVALAD
jgi:thioesterase domain-containing protein